MARCRSRPVRLFWTGKQDRLLRVDSIILSTLLTIAVRFRWLLVLLVACSLVLPRAVQPNPQVVFGDGMPMAVLSPQAGADLSAAGSAFDQPAGLSEPGEEIFGEGYSIDYPHEVDKLLSSFALHWGRIRASWFDVYFVVRVTDPVFPFERPPKPVGG